MDFKALLERSEEESRKPKSDSTGAFVHQINDDVENEREAAHAKRNEAILMLRDLERETKQMNKEISLKNQRKKELERTLRERQDDREEELKKAEDECNKMRKELEEVYAELLAKMDEVEASGLKLREAREMKEITRKKKILNFYRYLLPNDLKYTPDPSQADQMWEALSYVP